MMRITFVGVLALALMAPSAWAGRDLSWRAPLGAGGDSVLTLVCSSADSVATLVGTFQVPVDVPDFLGLQVAIDFGAESDTLPSFWHFENGACNRTGITYSVRRPETGAEGTEDPYAAEGGTPFSAIAAYGAEYGARNQGRLIAGAIRLPTPVPLKAGTNYFGFQLRFFFDNAKEAGGTCEGCRTPVTIAWTRATIIRKYAAPGDSLPREFDLTGGRPCVRVNGAPPGRCAVLLQTKVLVDSTGTTGKR